MLAKVDIPSTFGVVSRSNPLLIGFAALVVFAAWFLNTYKWQVLLNASGVFPRYAELLRLNFIGMFYNLVLPGQVGGEVVKGVSLARSGVSGATSAVSVVADRITGLLALFVLGIAGAMSSPSLAGQHPELMPWLVGIALVLGVATVVLVTGRGPAAVVAAGRAANLTHNRFVSRFGAALGNFPVPARGFSALWLPLALSFVFQLMIVWVNLLCCVALNIPISYAQLLWIVAIVTTLQSLPISIAGIGVREGAYVYLLHQQGADATAALALSLIIFALQVLTAVVGGVLQIQSGLRVPENPG